MARIDGTITVVGPLRLDRYVADELGVLTRSQLKTRLVSVAVNGKYSRLSRLVAAGDAFVIELLDEEDRSSATKAEAIPLRVLYEDANVIVVDKPQGMVVHPAHGNWSGTLANALLGRCDKPEHAPPRAGIVHRLDKDTSGVIIAARSAAAQEFLSAQFRNRVAEKTYLAIVTRVPRVTSGRVDDWLARDPKNRKRFAPAPEGTGKRAISDWRVLATSGGAAVLAMGLRTGRTHQLRVHCRELGCPIFGDPVYGSPDRRLPGATLMLHAYELRVLLPGMDVVSTFRAPVPERFLDAARALGFDAFPEPGSQ